MNDDPRTEQSYLPPLYHLRIGDRREYHTYVENGKRPPGDLLGRPVTKIRKGSPLEEAVVSAVVKCRAIVFVHVLAALEALVADKNKDITLIYSNNEDITNKLHIVANKLATYIAARHILIDSPNFASHLIAKHMKDFVSFSTIENDVRNFDNIINTESNEWINIVNVTELYVWYVFDFGVLCAIDQIPNHVMEDSDQDQEMQAIVNSLKMDNMPDISNYETTHKKAQKYYNSVSKNWKLANHYKDRILGERQHVGQNGGYGRMMQLTGNADGKHYIGKNQPAIDFNYNTIVSVVLREVSIMELLFEKDQGRTIVSISRVYDNDNKPHPAVFWGGDENNLRLTYVMKHHKHDLFNWWRGGYLPTFLQEWPKNFFDIAVPVMIQMCASVNVLHTLQPFAVVHRDIKETNFLFDPNTDQKEGVPTVLLADFGLARLLYDGESVNRADPNSMTYSYTDGYRPPETETYKRATTLSDIYALGITFRKLFTKSFNKEHLLTTKEMDVILNKVDKMIEEDPLKRPSAEEVMRCLEESASKHRLAV